MLGNRGETGITLLQGEGQSSVSFISFVDRIIVPSSPYAWLLLLSLLCLALLIITRKYDGGQDYAPRGLHIMEARLSNLFEL